MALGNSDLTIVGSDFSDDELDDDIDLGALETAKQMPQGAAPSLRPKASKIQHKIIQQPKPSTPQLKPKEGPQIKHLTHHDFDPDALQTYIYPTNLQIRDYQYNIVFRSFYHNTLVALPTGLGKTFIASTVILNFNRWFPSSKIIFMAPTKPLVAQQIKACCGITGIEASKVAILLDKLRRNRGEIWSEKQIFFTTPQVVENDLATGIVDPKSIVLLVIDEAHRSKGNYAYNNVAKFISRFNTNFRILAMTATPSSTVEGVQEIVDNLKVSKMEVRTESSIDIFRYLKKKTVERVSVETSDEVAHAMDLFGEAVQPILKIANEKQVYEVRDFRYINHFTAMDAQRRIMANKNIPEGLKWANHSLLSILAMAGQCIRRLNIYGVRSFYSYFSEKHNEFTTKFNNKKSKNSMAAKLHFHPSIKKLMSFCEAQISKPDFLGHRKLEIVISELRSFYEKTLNPDSRVIIFTEFRESALDIVRAIEAHSGHENPLKPHIFIGQAKERDKFDEEASSKTGKGKKTKDPSKSSSEQAQVTGMNQKLQKEIIKQFKIGVYNILVATSIGEEGLDIGEVDLIICYDSTSSPIKNIQRMGRTGRNRDGKVLVLFSGNEETKFDKAMGGYEYIQQHIMNGNMVDLHEQVRVIPNGFEPKVIEKLIEIPEENVELKNEEDEDEIIKIATKYMAKSKPSEVSSKKTYKKPAKVEKRFFMPDNVVTGFQSASSILNREEPRPPDLLDAILDSDVDDFEDLQNDPLFNTQEDTPDSKPSEATPGAQSEFRMVKETTKQPEEIKKQPEIMKYVSRSSNGSLGTRKRTISPERQGGKKAKDGAVVAIDTTPIHIKMKDSVHRMASEGAAENKSKEGEISQDQQAHKNSNVKDVSDGFSDDFSDDDEIMALVRRTQSVDKTNAGKQDKVESRQQKVSDDISGRDNKAPSQVSDDRLMHTVTDSDGILSKDEVTELYMNYYSPSDPRDLQNCYYPSNVHQEAEISHTPKVRSFLSFHEKIQSGVKIPTAKEPNRNQNKMDEFIVLDQQDESAFTRHNS